MITNRKDKKKTKPAVSSASSKAKSASKSAEKKPLKAKKETAKVAKVASKKKPLTNGKPAKAAAKPIAKPASKVVAKTKAAVKQTKAVKKSEVKPAKSASVAKKTPAVAKVVAPKVNGAKAVASKTAGTKANAPESKAPKVVNRIAEKVAKPEVPKKPRKPVVPPSNTSPIIVRKIRELQNEREVKKDLAKDVILGKILPNQPIDIVNSPQVDRLALIVRDSYWLHASWEITRRSVERARASLAEHWHTVRPILRLLKIDANGTTSNAETIYRDIEIHGGVRNWYIDIQDPPGSFRAQVGYLAGNGRFHELAASNVVTAPEPGSSDSVSEHWADIDKNAEHIFALSGGYNEEVDTKDLRQMFEEKLNRPMGAPALTQFGSGAESGFRRPKKFHFEVEAEMVVYGSTRADAYVTLSGEPVKVESDGTFSVRVGLPDRRQVIPVIASTRDGVDEQTIVIMVERNTKILEPLSKENEE